MSDAAAHLPPILRRLHLLRGSAGVASGRALPPFMPGVLKPARARLDALRAANIHAVELTAARVLQAADHFAALRSDVPDLLLRPASVRALLGPFPAVQVLVTGGVVPTSVGDWLPAGALAVGLGSALFGRADDEWPALFGEVLDFTQAAQA